MDDLERMRHEMRWLANDWDRKWRGGVFSDVDADHLAEKLAEQMRHLSRWNFSERAAGPWSGLDWREADEDFDALGS